MSVIGCPTHKLNLTEHVLLVRPSGVDLTVTELQRHNLVQAQENIVYYGVWQFGTYYGWDNFTEQDLGAFDLSQWAGETVDIRFRFRTGFEGSTSDSNESQWTGRDGFAVDDVEIWKQTTSFLPNPQTQQVQINLNNLAPGEEYTTSARSTYSTTLHTGYLQAFRTMHGMTNR